MNKLKIVNFQPSKGGSAIILEVKPSRENGFAQIYIRAVDIPKEVHSKIYKDVLIQAEIEFKEEKYVFKKFIDIEKEERKSVQESKKSQFRGSEKKITHKNSFAKQRPISRRENEYLTTTTKNIKDINELTNNTNGFINPYNFIEHASIPPQREKPISHEKLLSDHKTGKIQCTITTKSYLFIGGHRTKQTEASEANEIIQFIRKNNDLFIPGSSLRGMIRSTYELITNSCFSIFDSKKNLSYRTNKYAPKLKGGIIRKENGKFFVELFEIAPVNVYGPDFIADRAVSYHNRKKFSNLVHGTTYKIKLQDVFVRQRVPIKVVCDVQANTFNNPDYIDGIYCSTSSDGRPNIDHKSNERFFYQQSNTKSAIKEIPQNVQQRHKELLKHWKNDVKQANLKQNSRHLISKEIDLVDNELVFVHYEEKASEILIKDLFPAMVTRAMEKDSIGSLLDEKFHRCNKYEELCPGCRLFGWTKEKKDSTPDEKVAYKSRIKIGSANLKTKEVKTLDKIFTATGSPRPTTKEFYLKQKNNEDGSNWIEKKEFSKTFYYNKEEMEIRGRKIYLRFNTVNNEWQASTFEKQNIPQQLKLLQNIIEPETEFIFDIYFENLTNEELGGLIYTLELEPDLTHKLGFGKPAGFGSIKISINSLEIEDLITRYTTLSNRTISSKDQYINIFKQSMEKYFEKKFDQIQHIKQFIEGIANLPSFSIHYPRRNRDPTIEKKGYEWFVNNRKGKGINKRNENFVQLLPKIDASKKNLLEY